MAPRLVHFAQTGKQHQRVPRARVMGQESGLRQDRWLFNEGPGQPKCGLPTRSSQSPSGAITFYALIKQPGQLFYRRLGFGWRDDPVFVILAPHAER
jgi:hypothetical protein